MKYSVTFSSGETLKVEAADEELAIEKLTEMAKSKDIDEDLLHEIEDKIMEDEGGAEAIPDEDEGEELDIEEPEDDDDEEEEEEKDVEEDENTAGSLGSDDE